MDGRGTWRRALARRDVWLRALSVGLPVGLCQVVLNQGDHWLAGAVDRAVVAKTVLTPLVTVCVALVAAAGGRRKDRLGG